MDVARQLASWSKDPKRKVGCVIIDDDKNQLSGGFNGFPRGISDDERLLNKPVKLQMIVHAEANAVAAAARNGHSLKGSTAYVTSRPCCQCAALLIQAGVKRVVCLNEGKDEDIAERAQNMMTEAGVSWDIYAGR